MDLNEARKRIPEIAGLNDEAALNVIHEVYYPTMDKAVLSERLGYKAPPPPVPERSTARAVGDLGLQFAGGAVSGVRMMTDLAGANNRASTGLRSAEDALRELQSATAKADQAKIAQILQESQDKGFGDQVLAGIKAFGVAPGAMMAQALGTSVPTLATAAIPGVGPAAVAGRLGAAGAIGAAQGAGNIKGVIYEDVKRTLTAEGKFTPEEIEARATEAQAYSGPNAGQIALGGGLGAVAGSTGMERAVSGLRNGVTQAAPGMVARMGMGAAAEAVPEMAQGGQEKLASNLALGNEGFDVNPMAGVVSGATMEGLAGGAMGAAAGIPRPSVITPGDRIRATEAVPESGPMTRAANVATEQKAQAADAALRLGFNPLAGTPVVFPDGSVALGSEQEAAKRTEVAGQKAEANQNANIEQFAANRPPMLAGDAARILGEAKTRGLDFTVAPHPQGGFMVVPRNWVTPQLAAQTMVDLENTIVRMAEADAAPVVRAPRTDTSAQDLNLNTDPVAAYVDNLRTVNTPAAKLYVRDFDAGRITPEDVQQRMAAERGKTPDERLAEAAAEGLKMNPKGDPFKTLMAAQRATKTTPGSVIQVEGGYAIRTRQEPTLDAQATPEADAVPVQAKAADAAPDTGAAPGLAGPEVVAEPESQPALNPDQDWQAFPPDTQTLGLPRAEMPQVKAQHRGALTNYLNARGVAHESDEVDADTLKPTQAEFSLSKVQKARDFSDTDRSILVSSDGYVVDGHHQWIARGSKGEKVKVIRLKAPIADLLPMVREFPSSTVDEATANVQDAQAPADEGAIEAEAAPVETPAPAGGDGATADGVPAEGGAGDAQADGVKQAAAPTVQQLRDMPIDTKEQAAVFAKGYAQRLSDELPIGQGRFMGAKSKPWTVEHGDLVAKNKKANEVAELNYWQKPYEDAIKEARFNGLPRAKWEAERKKRGLPVEAAAAVAAPDPAPKETAIARRKRLKAERETPAPAPEPAQEPTPAPVAPAPEPVETAPSAEAQAAPQPVETEAPAPATSQELESVVVKDGKGLIKGKFLAEVDGGGVPGGPWDTRDQAILAGEAWKQKTIQNAKDTAAEKSRWEAIADKVRAGKELSTVEIESLGLKSSTSDVRWFFPIAARLFDITSRDIRPMVKDLIRDSFTDMGAKREFVPTRQALDAIAGKLKEEAEPAPAGKVAGPKKPAEKIEDFGEKLQGARKDYATQLKDAMEVDVAAAPLSQSWPDPDYQKLLDGGADVRVVAMVRAMRDEVPTKPQSSWKLRGWVDKVTTLRKFAQDLMDGTQEYTKLRAEMEKQVLLRDQVVGRADLYEEVGHDKSLKGITFQQHRYSFYRGETNVTKWAIEQKAKATAMSNWPREIAVADTREQALDQFKAKYATLDAGSKGKGKASFVVYRKRNEAGAFVGKKIGREYIDLHKAEDVKAAREYLQNNAAELEKKLERYKDTPYERNAENAPRVGDDHRGGAPVTPEVFAETFGFRGVQFGNYVEQGRRQSDLNEAFDALMDMAAVLDIPPRAISLSGRLGLAFGARGKGGKNAPAAHYEPGNVVINLTKGGGPGSLAHEWFHAMDNYFAKESGEAGYMTDAARGDKLRAEMRAAFTAIKRAVQAGALKTRSMELDKRKTKPYWSTPLEMSARSFESYIIARLQDQNAANDYLANIIDEKVWQVSEEMRAEFFAGQKAPPTYPYPTVDELPALRAAFDEFFKTVQTRESDDGAVTMFQRIDADAQAGDTPTDVQPDTRPEAPVNIGLLGRDIATYVGMSRAEVDAIRPYDARVISGDAELREIAESFGSEVQGFGLRVDLEPAEKKRFGFFGGVRTSGVIFLRDTGGDRPHLAVLGHELAHEMRSKKPALYNKMVDAIQPYINIRRYETEFVNSVVARDVKNPDKKQEEFIGEVLSDGFMDKDFWRALGDANPSLLRQIGGMVMDLVDKVLAKVGYTKRTERYLKDYKAVMQIAGQVMAEYGVSKATTTGLVFQRIEPATPGSPDATRAKLMDAVPQGVIDRLSDITTSQRGFNRWWHRTVGTQLHKAKTNKQFAPVYYAVQDFMKDVSRMATLAADQAPDLLPQVDSLGDIKKLLPVMGVAGNRKRKAELKQASEALFDGTLRYTRNEAGEAVLATEDDAKGIIWTTAELKARGMSDSAIALYRQARKAINQSLDNLLAADVYRMITAAKPESLAATKPEYDAMMDRVRKAAASNNPGAALSEVSRGLLDQQNRAKARLKTLKASNDGQPNENAMAEIGRLAKTINGIEEIIEQVDGKIERIADLKASGYAPLMRFGQYTLDAVDASGTRVFFGMYESQMASNAAARKFREDGLTVRQGIQSQREFELLKGVSPETAMLFAEMMGLEKNDAMQAWLQNAVAEQSALKRHIRRKGVEGFENDASRVVAAFITSNSRAASRALHGMRIQNLVENVRDGDVKDEAIALTEYVNNPKEEAQAIRSLLFVNYIGGSVASALVNLTQTMVQTFPYLAQYGGPAKAAKRLGGAMKVVLGKIEDPDLAAAVRKAEESGVIKPQEVFQLQAEASRTLGSDLRVRAGLAAWGSFFQMAEVFNRRVAFVAAFQTAKEQGIADPYAFAENAVDETQGVFNKGNRPDWARGAVGATLFTFKTFMIQYVEFLKRLPNRERALALGMLVLLSGIRGLPFAEDAEDLVDTVAQQLGYNFTTKEQMDRFLVATLGKGFADFVQNGASTIPGVPFDVSARLGMSDLLPGTALLKPSETRKEEQVLDVFGVAGGFVRDALKGEFRPIAIRNLAKGLEMYDRGIYTDTRGRKVMEVDGVDAVMKGIGLQPNNVAAESRAVRTQYEKRALFTSVKNDISEKLALGMFEQNQDKVKAAREKLDDWNEKNPEAKIVINSQAIRRRVVEMRKDRAERFLRSTPKELKASTREAVQ